MASLRRVAVSGKFSIEIIKWHVAEGQEVARDAVLASYIYCGGDNSSSFVSERKLKSRFNGRVVNILVGQNQEALPSEPVITINEEHCLHTIVMKDMCCECGEDLRMDTKVPGQLAEPVAAAVPMVHNIPELKVSLEEAERLARYDERELLRMRKLALVVDLDQTLIHTTHETVPRDLPDVFHYQLPDHPFEYHTKLRPGAKKFLQAVAEFYELHIFTMGSRMYAHTIARHLDPDEKLFAHRIRSRDECIDAFSKSRDLRSLFPCGDHMVCIIDDREDVWDFAPNLITVKPYQFFKGTGDVNDPFLNKTASVPVSVEDEKLDDKEVERGTSDSSNSTNQDATNNTLTKEDNEEKDFLIDGNQGKVNSDNDCKEEQAECGNVDNEAKGGTELLEIEAIDKNKPESCSNGSHHPPDLDDYLFYLEEVLERIHASFYATVDVIKAKGGLSHQDPQVTKFCTPGTMSPDTRRVIPSLRQEVLRGANVVFTGVVPTNVPLAKSTIYRTAVSLGANVTDSIICSSSSNHGRSGFDSEEPLYTTHLVAARLGTEKAYRASKVRNVKLVGVEWLWCCAQRWEWVDERLFPVENESRGNGVGTPEVSSKEFTTSNKKSKSKLANRNGSADEEAQSINSNLLYENTLEAIIPISFNKEELDSMDKEVEEYMLSDEDGSDEEQDVLGSVSGSSGRNSSASSSSSSSLSVSSKNSSSSSSLERSGKRTRPLTEESELLGKKRREIVTGDFTAGDFNLTVNNSNSSVSSENSNSSNSSEEDLQFGELLEKQIEDS